MIQKKRIVTCLLALAVALGGLATAEDASAAWGPSAYSTSANCGYVAMLARFYGADVAAVYNNCLDANDIRHG